MSSKLEGRVSYDTGKSQYSPSNNCCTSFIHFGFLTI